MAANDEGKLSGIAAKEEVLTRLEGKFKATVVCWFLGLGTLIAWNSMVTVGDYYYTLFPHYHPSRVLPLINQTFSMCTTAILTYNNAKFDTRKRILFGFTLFMFSIVALIIVDIATSGKGGIVAYILICFFVACFGVASAHVEGGVVGELSFMSPKFRQSFFAGFAASGAVTSLLRLITKAAFHKDNNGLRKGAVLFLGISILVQLMCIILYAIVFPKLPVVKYYRLKAAEEGSNTVSADLAAAGIQKGDNSNEVERLSVKQLLHQNLDYCLALFFLYALTLSIFPGFLYENTGNHQLGSWYPLVLVTMYNVLELISGYIPLVKCLKLESRKGLLVAVLVRFLFIPAFYFTAKYGDKGWMMMIVCFLGFSQSYLIVCVMMVAPKGYKGPEQYTLGNLLVAFQQGGLLVGVSLGLLWIIGKSGF